MYYERNADGAVVNPPVIRRFEDEMAAATAAADYPAIVRVQQEYNQARDELVKGAEGKDSAGLGWSADDMRGGLTEDQTAADIMPRLPEGAAPIMPAGMSAAQVEEQRALRAEVADMRRGMAELLAALTQRGESVPPEAGFEQPVTDAPTPVPTAGKPLGGTGVSAGRVDRPNAPVDAGQPLGGTNVSAGPVDPANPVPEPYRPPPTPQAPPAGDENGGES